MELETEHPEAWRFPAVLARAAALAMIVFALYIAVNEFMTLTAVYKYLMMLAFIVAICGTFAMEIDQEKKRRNESRGGFEMKRKWKRTLSTILSVAMLFSMTGMNTVFALESGQTVGASGLCEHHTEHSEDVCGYTDRTPGTPCAHEHMEDCYKEMTKCIHEHSDDCYPVEDSVLDNDATPSDAEQREPTECIHICSEESGCIATELQCQHEHGENCGYAPALTCTPCTFVCGECGKDIVEQNPPPAKDELVQIITGFTGFDGSAPLDIIEVTEKSTVAAIGLPETLNVTLDDKDGETAIPVTWETADGSDYENTAFETYDFTPVWDAASYALADGLTDWDVLFITVNIAGMENPNTKDITTADALKTALEETTSATISVTEDISLTGLGAITVGASHTLSVAEGKTVTIDGSTGINVNTHTLTIQGADGASSTLMCNRSSGYALYGSSGSMLRLKDITMEVTDGLGLQITDADIGSGARLVLNAPDQRDLVTVNGSLDVSGEIDIQDFDNIAISFRGGSMTIKNGGTVKVGEGSQRNVGIEVRNSSKLIVESGGALTGGAGAGGIELLHSGYSGAVVTGVADRFIDRGQTLTANGQVTVTAATEPASDTSLTAGVYIWNDEDAFEKHDIATIEVSSGGQTKDFSVARGSALQFAAVVKDAGGTEVDAALRDVTWTLYGGTYAAGTTISDTGLLMVAQDETADTVYVAACSVKNPAVVNFYISVSVTDGTANTWGGDGASLTAVNGDTIVITNTASGTLAIPNGATVTIAGTVTDAGMVQLNPGAGAKVNWEASYTGSNDDGPLVQGISTTIDATSTIEITGEIVNTGTTRATAISVSGCDVIVAGGTVSGQLYGVYGENVTINAGSTVTSTSDIAVGAKKDIIINGGTITGGSSGQFGNATVAAPYGSVTLAGGTITAYPGARAVHGSTVTVTGDVTISGDVGIANFQWPTTITVNSGGTFTVPSSGTLTVNNTGTIINNGAIVNNGVIVNNGTITNHAGSSYTGASPTGTGTFTPPPSCTTYALTVTNGAGGGSYAEGQTVTITANPASSNQRFKGWTVNSGGVTFANPQAQSTTFTMPANAVEVTATYEALPADTYSITVQNDGNGTASANVNSAQQGAAMTLTATANSGYRFKEWQVVSGGVSIANNSFTMSVANVTVKAIFERIPTTAHTITFNANGGSVSQASAVTGADGRLSSLPTPTRSGSDQFDGWFTAASGGTQITTATVFTADITVYAHWTDTSDGGGGGSSSVSSTPTVTSADPDKPDTATNAETKVTPTVNADGSATVTVAEKSVTDAIKAAQDAAKKAGTEKNGISITIDAITTKGANDITAILTEQSVGALIKAGVTEVRIKGDVATITLDLAALKAAWAVAGGAITVSAKPMAANTLSAAAQNAIGDRPVFKVALTSDGKAVIDFGNGSVSVAIPYTLGANEKAGNVQAVYVDDNSKVTWLTNSSYDTNTKALLFSIGHFSVFGVGYRTDAPAFTDIANHWAKDDIEFVVARGLLSGTGNNQFSPNSPMTRVMFVTALGRLAGVDTNSYKTDKFTDVKADAYYAPYANWAAEKGIVSGTTATTFAPDSAVTRQEMAVIMANYAKALGYTVPKTREAVTFADNANIASWTKDAAKAMQMAGLINGKDGNRFDPTGTATRAEVAAVLHHYVELVIDPATAQGFTQNDAGQWLYYENGKPVTGWKQVDSKWYYLDTAGLMQSGGWKQIGGKWYYLYADGSMAVSTKIDSYEVGPDGAWKES